MKKPFDLNLKRIRSFESAFPLDISRMMGSLIDASKVSTEYAVAAHKLGMTIKSIIEDISTHGHNHLTEENLEDILNGISQIPNLTYHRHDPAIKATNAQNTLRICPVNPWASRFILTRSAKNETNSTIFAEMQRRGYDIPGEDCVEVVLQEYLFIEKELAQACHTRDDAALQMIIPKAYHCGYTVPEIVRRIHRNTARPKRSTQIETMVKLTLESNGIPEALHRSGRKLNVAAEKFMLCAYNLGMEVNEIRDQMFAHGFNYDELTSIVKTLKKQGVCQGQEHRQTKPSQAAQPTQPSARDHVLPGKAEIAAQSVLANQEPIRRIDVMDLLN